VEKTQAATSATLIQMKSMDVMNSDTPIIWKWFRYVCVYLILVLNAFTNAYASTNSNKEIEKYKLYSHIKLTNHNEYLCLEKLWYLESRWNPRAANKHSTAYGIPQLLKLKTKDPYKQIDAGLKYIAHRYGKPCKALTFHLKHGYY
jgi:hypothetical protein